MSDDLCGLSWWGGKTAVRNDGIGRWVAAQLPRRSWYVEPFAGMLGVLLQRRPSRRETVNDLDGRIPNWWRVVRDRPDELTAKLTDSPLSRHEYDHCAQAQWDTTLDDVERARCFTVSLWQSRSSKDRWQTDHQRITRRNIRREVLVERIHKLADRIRDIDIEQIDALEVVDRFAANPDAVIYCDPPYRSDNVGARMYDKRHYHAHIDHGALQAALLDADAAVAVSGNPGDYPALLEAGWRETTTTRIVANTRPDERATKRRLEALVCNFDPLGQGTML